MSLQRNTDQRNADSHTATENSPPLPAIPANIFRAYDIRGVVDEQLTPMAIHTLGRAIASEALDAGIQSLLIGYDGRLSSPAFSRSLIDGVLACGCNVIDLGLVPTPLLYFATHTSPADSGIMLTASHNPANYNGLKAVFRRHCLAENQIQALRRRIDQGAFASGAGDYHELNIREAYSLDVCERIQLKRRLRIVIDCGNAVPGIIAPTLFRRLGCDVSTLYCDVDGHFPNHHPDPTVPANLANLSARVVSEGADLGLAFDGDGDRLGVVTASGHPVAADHLLLLLAEAILPHYPGADVVFDVKCSSELDRLVRELGGNPVMHRSGHAPMKQKMVETGAPLGGEFAAHFFIKDRWYGFDDGLYTAARILEIVSALPHSLGQELAHLQTLIGTAEIKVPIAEEAKFAVMAELRRAARFPGARLITLDGLRVEYPDGWGLVRASNTSPALLLRFEAASNERLEEIKQSFKALIRTVDKTLDLEF